MNNPFDHLLLSTGEDGASTPVTSIRNRDAAEIDRIMDAWFQERQDNIECGMFLDQARKLLTRILADGELTLKTRRQVKSFMLAMQECRRDHRRF